MTSSCFKIRKQIINSHVGMEINCSFSGKNTTRLAPDQFNYSPKIEGADRV